MSKVNAGQASSTLIPKYIGSDFDKVVSVANNIEQVVVVSDNIEDVGTVADNINYVKEVAEDLHGMPVTMYTGENPPVLNPMPEGVMWYCTTDGRTYVWYTDADSGQWVESAPQSAMKDEATNIFFHSVPSNVNPAYRSATLHSTPSPEAEISVAHNTLNTPVVQAQFIREEALWVDVSVTGAQGIVTLMGYSSGNSQLKAEIITWKNGAEGTSLGASQWVTLPSQPSVVSLPVTLANIDVLEAGDLYVVKLTSQMNAGGSAVSTILVDGNTSSRFGIIFNTNLIGLNDGIRDGVTTSAPTENAVYDALQLKVGKSQLVQSGNLTPTANWANVPTYSDSELGGSGGPLNAQAKALTARSELLLTDVREALRRSYAEAGYNLVDGSFEAGGTLVNANDVLLQERTGKVFSGPAGTVAAGTNPASGGFVDRSGALTVSYFDTVSDMVAFKAHVVGNTVKTRGYYSVDDGGGSEYLISNGVPAQDFDDAGSVPITGSLFAKLTKQPVFDLRQFGVKASDQAYSVINDIGIANAVKRARFGFCRIMINGVFYYTKPIVIDYCTWIEGNVLGSDPSLTSRLIKVGNATSGLPSLGYPGHAGSINYDVDAGIIVTRQNAATSHTQGVVLKNFLLVSQDKSRYSLYAPHMVDFDIQFDSRGFNIGAFWHDIYLGRLAGRHIGLGDAAPDKAASIGVWSAVFSTTATCGNSVSFRLSLNGFCRGMQIPNFGNGVLERLTLENIRKPVGGPSESYGISATDSYLTGVVSCEGSSTCILRAGNGSNFDVMLGAVFHVTESTPTEGLVHSLNGGRITLQGGSNIFGDYVDQKIINEAGGYLDISSNVKLLNIKLLNSDAYRFKDRAFGVGNTAGVTANNIASGSPVLFTVLQGTVKASLVSGVVTFNSPALVKVTLQGRNMTSGTIAFGLNGALNDVITVGQDRAVIVPVVAGDVMTVQATSAVVLASAGGVRMLIEPVL